MTNGIVQQLTQTTKPVVVWFQTRGLDFASDLAAALILFLIGYLGIKLLTKLLRALVVKRVGERALLANFVVSVIVKLAWAVLLMVVLGTLGVAVGPLVAGLGVTGFILGFACQESLASLAAGVMIALNQPFKIGDRVTVAGHTGVIHHLDMMVVVLVTDDQHKVTIPNKQCWGAAIVNFSTAA